MQKESNINKLLKETRQHISTIFAKTPILQRILQKHGITVDSPETLAKMPVQIYEVKNCPVVTTAFCGPSGAGKSTMFNLATGLKTPAGGAVRPMTHASLVAIPQQIEDKLNFEKLFPTFRMTPMGSTSDLRNPGTPIDNLFFTSYQGAPNDKNVWVPLIDIPDFNTTHIENWSKAEQIIQRADSVIFTVYGESYKNQKTFEILKKVLKLCGSLTYVLTKIDQANCKENATAIRNDLIECAKQDSDFLETRADKETLVSFLEKAPFYYSAYSNSLSLDSVTPLANSNEKFSDHIFGQQGISTILKRQLQSIAIDIKQCEIICNEAQNLYKTNTKEIQKIEKEILKASERVVGEEFPVFAILEIIRKIIEKNRPTLLKRLFSPIMVMSNGIKSIASKVGKSINSISSGNGVFKRNDLERARLQKEITRLIDSWRKFYSKNPFSTEQCRHLEDELLRRELPPVDSQWEKYVESELQEWQKTHRGFWVWLNIINDIFLLLGTTLVAVDLFVDGGLGTLGIVSIIGGSSAIGGFLLALFNNMGLGNQVLNAHKKWKEIRCHDYFEHIKSNLAEPLLLEGRIEIDKELSPKAVSACEYACQELGKIQKGLIRYGSIQNTTTD